MTEATRRDALALIGAAASAVYASPASAAQPGAVTPEALSIDYRPTPSGVTAPRPRFGWTLAPRDPALYFVQRLRDEAHRFAIGTHRARRKKEFTKSPLEEIAGVGPARKRALLHAFGTAKAIARAALSDLEKVPGINAATARLVYDFFHANGG